MNRDEAREYILRGLKLYLPVDYQQDFLEALEKGRNGNVVLDALAQIIMELSTELESLKNSSGDSK